MKLYMQSIVAFRHINLVSLRLRLEGDIIIALFCA